MISILNPENGAPIKDIINRGGVSKEYAHNVGETLVYDDDVARILLDKYGFLTEIVLEQKPSGFKCPYCEYINEYRVAVFAHMKSNHKDKEKVNPEVVLGDVKPNDGKEVISPFEQKKMAKQERWEETKALAEGKTDKDGIEWYGDGLKKDEGGES